MAATAAGVPVPDFWQMTFWEFGAVLAARVEASGGQELRAPDDLFEALAPHAVEVPR